MNSLDTYSHANFSPASKPNSRTICIREYEGVSQWAVESYGNRILATSTMSLPKLLPAWVVMA